jgi:hypothetical protein
MKPKGENIMNKEFSAEHVAKNILAASDMLSNFTTKVIHQLARNSINQLHQIKEALEKVKTETPSEKGAITIALSLIDQFMVINKEENENSEPQIPT